MIRLPQIMVAPTGARRTKADHPMLPITPDDIARTARACQIAGAGAIHIHVRNDDGSHLLDAARYRQAMTRIADRAPGLLVQVSTEAVGRYSPPEQIRLVHDLRPDAISIALRELVPAPDALARAAAFYDWCANAGIHVQHILYDAADVAQLSQLVAQGAIDGSGLSLLYVLGRYTAGQQSAVADLAPFMAAATALPQPPDWMVCAFGQGETDCLAAALRAGGKVRVGFENNLLHADGSLAASNEARVAVIRALADQIAIQRGDGT